MESRLRSLNKYKIVNETLYNKVFLYISFALYAIIVLELMIKPPVFILDLFALLLCASFIFSPLFAVPPLIITAGFFDSLYIFKAIPYSAVLAFALIIGVLLSLLRTNRKPNFKYLILCGVIILYAFLNSIFGFTHNFEYSFIFALNILLVYALANFATSRNTLELVMKCFFFLAMAIISICFVIYIFNLGFYREGHFTLHSNMNGINSEFCLNPNNFAKGLEQCCAVFLIGIFMVNKIKIKALFVVFIIISIFLAFMTGSRTGFLTIGIGIIAVSILSGIYGERNTRKADWFAVCSIFIIAGLVYIFLTAIKVDIVSRFTVDSVVQSGGTGRTIIWDTMLTKIIPEHMWFGVGCGEHNIMAAMVYYSGIPNYSHNIIFSLLGQFGIIGSSMLLIPFVLIIDKLILGRKKIKYVMLPLSLIFFAVINGFGEGMVDFWGLWVSVGFGLFLYNMDKNQSPQTMPERRFWGIF